VSKFRLAAFSDYRLGLALYGTPRVMERFQDLDHYAWPAGSPRVGWAQFLRVSVLMVGAAEGPVPLVAFYNPWVDLFLLTAWEVVDGGVRVIDAELLIGDWVRKRGQLPFDFTPAWLRGGVFRPAAVGMAVADALRAFEALFPTSDAIADWRSRLPGLQSPRLLVDHNYLVAGHHLVESMLGLDAFASATDGEDPRLVGIRAAVEDALSLAAQGRVQSLLQSASDTLPATQKTLGELPADAFAGLRVAAVVLDKQASLVFLVPQSPPNYFVSLLLEGRGGQPRVSRVDLVAYAAMYAVDAEAPGAGAGKVAP
jgi:hypothetical protein